MDCYDPHDDDPADVPWLPMWPAWCALIVSFCVGATVNALIASPTAGLGIAVTGMVVLLYQACKLKSENNLLHDEIEALRGEIDILNMRQTP